jgi:hypothetical protein
VDSARKVSGISEILKANSCTRDTTLIFKSTREAIKKTNPITAAALVISAALIFTYLLRT